MSILLDRKIKAPPGGWFDTKGMVHKLHVLACDELNRNLATAWQAVDHLLSTRDGPSLDPEAEIDDSDGEIPIIPTSSQTGSIPKARAMAAVAALAMLIHTLLEKGKRLHINHSHGIKVAQLFEEDDPMRQGADGERLKHAIKAEKELLDRKKASERRPSQFNRGGSSRFSSMGRGAFGRDRDFGTRGRWSGVSGSGSTRRCYICHAPDHLSHECPRGKRS